MSTTTLTDTPTTTTTTITLTTTTTTLVHYYLRYKRRLYYETFKVLRVRDRRLGGIYRLFQGTILIYITSSIIYQQRYLKTENVINGAVRVTLKAPADGIASSAYCQSSSLPCLFWNEHDILYEPGVDGALITTRAQIRQYGPFTNTTSTGSSCDVNIPTVAGCDPYSAPSTLLLPTSLVSDIERFTLMLEHSIRGQATGVQIRSGNMEYGVLRDSSSGEVVKTFNDALRYVPDVDRTGANITTNIASSSTSTDPNTVKSEALLRAGALPGTVHLAGDVMTVGEFLKAAGVDLDALSGSPAASVNETVRSSGVVVIVVIQYAAKGWNPNRISYEYLPKAIPDQEYKVIETIRDFRDGNRVEINRHGIRIVFSQAGQLGQFSFMTLLTNLVAAVALFKVANIIVELMMLRLHPHKKVYDRAKFESTKDDKGKQKKEGFSAGRDEKLVSDLQIADRGYYGHMDSSSQSNSGIGTSNGSSTIEGVKDGGGTRGVNGTTHATKPTSHSGYSADSSEDGHGSDSDYSESDDDEMAAGAAGSMNRNQPQESTKRSTQLGLRSNDPVTTMEHGHASFLYSNNNSNNTKELHRRSKTPVSANGTFGRSSSSSLGKSADYMSAVDWSRNGSSSGLLLNSDSRPGIIAKGGAYHPRQRPQSAAGEEVEIETRFGPVRPNEFKGFNPGGLVIGGGAAVGIGAGVGGGVAITASLSSPSQTKIANSFSKGAATPEMRPITVLATPISRIQPPAATALQSPPSMQAVSPSPVFFGTESSQTRVSASASSVSKNKSRTCQQHRSRQNRTNDHSQKASSPERYRENEGAEGRRGRLSSRLSSSSLSSMGSSSSLSSSEGSICSMNDSRTVNTAMSFGLSGANASSTWSFGMPESPGREYSSGGENMGASGATPKSQRVKQLHSSASNPNLTLASSSSSTTSAFAEATLSSSSPAGVRHGHKKPKTDKHRPALTATQNTQSTHHIPSLNLGSESPLSTSMFNLGSPSNLSNLSLSLSTEPWGSESDLKGKKPEVSSTSSKKPLFGPNAFTPSSSSTSSFLPLRRSSLATETMTASMLSSTTTVFHATPSHSASAYATRESGSFRPKHEVAGSSMLTASSSAKGKDVQRSLRDRTLRSSCSSPSLLNDWSSGHNSTRATGSGDGATSASASASIVKGSSSGASGSSSTVPGSMQLHAKDLRVSIPSSLVSTGAQVLPPRIDNHASGSGFITTGTSVGGQLPTRPSSSLSLSCESPVPSRPALMAFTPSSEYAPDSGIQMVTPSAPAFSLNVSSSSLSSEAQISMTRPYSTYLDYSASGITTSPSHAQTIRPLPHPPTATGAASMGATPIESSVSSTTITPTATASSSMSQGSLSYGTTRSFGSSSTPNLLLHNSTSEDVSTARLSTSGPYLNSGVNHSSPSLGLASSLHNVSTSGVGSSSNNNIKYPTYTTTPTSTTPTFTTNTSNMTTATSTTNNYVHPTTTFFTSPITSSCTTTLAGTGIRVLGRTITMVTADNKKLLLRRSEPLILNEGVGEEKAARI
ncbi:cytochrome c oxidase subunit 1 [Podila epigama]|nr:cytochrome c oxidase subunit 1 [Podila epigama]